MKKRKGDSTATGVNWRGSGRRSKGVREGEEEDH